MEKLTEELRSTTLNDNLGELEQLLFTPQADSGIQDAVLDGIPRYLFRVASPRSDGLTNETWARSESAHQNNDSSTRDIFSNLNDDKRADIAQMLNLHLRWWPKYGLEDKDNFVSWTSSLLFAIQFIYYRHQSFRDGSSLADIKLYVVDTTKFPRGTFIRDLDLMDIFAGFDESLKDFRTMRRGSEYYFGEFLSQGSLKIEHKCQVIPSDILFEDNRLRRIQPQFAEINSLTKVVKPEWAREVVRLRNAIWPNTEPPTLALADMLDRLQAIDEIIKDVAPDWKLPIAIYFVALMGTTLIEGDENANDNTGKAYSQSASSPEDQQIQDNFESFIVVAATMPELKQVNQIARAMDYYLRLKEAGALENVFSEDGHSSLADDPDEMATRIGQLALTESDTEQELCKENTPGSSEAGSDVS